MESAAACALANIFLTAIIKELVTFFKRGQAPLLDGVQAEETEEPSLCFDKMKRFGDRRTVPLFPGEVIE